MMLDLKKVLSEEELAKLSEIRVRHRDSLEEAKEKVEEEEEHKEAKTEPIAKAEVEKKREKKK